MSRAGVGVSPHRLSNDGPSSDESSSKDGGAEARRLLAIPSGAEPTVRAVRVGAADGSVELARELLGEIVVVESVGMLRDQAVAVIKVDLAALAAVVDLAGAASVEIEVRFEGARSPVSSPTGPMSRVCARTIENYETQPEDTRGWQPPATDDRTRGGTVSYCGSVSDCADNAIDALFLVAEEVSSTPSLFAYANHHASYLGLNVGIVSMTDLPDASAAGVHQFISDVYETRSAEHFGDGHLGFVLLVGDAYADDNATVMIPVYNGYGGTESASDHYYACVSGDDDFEDVMLGRLSVGNLQELSAALGKSASYMPLTPDQTWHERVLLIGGLFYTIKDDYVALFDEYDELIPENIETDRLYRHDYSTNESCALDVVDAFNDGYLFVNFNGDGWISVWEYTMNTGHIGLMENSQRLPIVLSMACSTGWLDNVSSPDANGSYDCLAEQLVNAPNGGAVACIAAPRSSDGGIFRGFTKEIYRAAFEQDCVFTGELLATAKLLHLQSEGNVSHARQFALFGDPMLIFGRDIDPSGQPDLAAKPYQTTWSPENPMLGDDLHVSVGVSNQSSVAAQDVVVRLDGVSETGSYQYDTSLPTVGPWATERAEFLLPAPVLGAHEITVSVDPGNVIPELTEDNNSFTHGLYVFPGIPGFPVELGKNVHSPCVASLGDVGRHILIPDDDAGVWSLDASGSIDWVSTVGWGASFYGREVAAASGDLDGDGINEIVSTKFLGVVALSAGGGEMWTANTSDPVGHPVLADADADGDLDVVVSARGYFGGPSSIIAIDEDGNQIWSHPLGDEVDVTTSPVAGDFDLDGIIDVAYGTSAGTVEMVSCASTPPADRCAPFVTGTLPVTALCLADVDSDGLLEIVAAGQGVSFINSEDGSSAGWSVELGAQVVSLAIGDTDDDGEAEVLAGTADGTMALIDSGVLSWSRPVTGVPGSSAAIADVDGTSGPEILFGTDAGYFQVLTPDGDDYISPMPVPGSCLTPFVSDLTGDGTLDVVVCSSDGVVYAFNFGGLIAEQRTPDWHGLGGSASRTSVLEQPFWGTFDGNLVLSGNFHIVDDLIISAGSTLTIAADARLAFNDSALEVAGTLHAPGMPGSEITMTRSPASGAGWRGLKALPGASIYMSSCLVTDAVTGLDANSAAVTLVDCEFTRNGSGVDVKGCSLYASGDGFSHADEVGLSVEGGSGTVIDCQLDGNGTSGLTCVDAPSYRFARDTFSGTEGGNGADFTNSSHCVVDSCVFVSNSASGALVKQSSPSFHSSRFSNNGLYGVECEKLSLPTLSWCTVTGNRIGVSCRTGAYANLGDDIDPDSGYNSIHGNQQAAVANLNVQPSPVKARRNWWGAAPPAGRIFMGYVVYAPWLLAAPDPSLHTSDVAGLTTTYGLSQNRPNPFNPVTTLEFSAPPSAGPIRVTVHDSAGRLVRTLHDGPASGGTHELVWDGRDDHGNRVATGVYFARMVASDFGATRKMLLLK